MEIYSKHCQSQTIRAGELKFWENVYPPPCVTCHLSYVRCQVSGVRCHFFHFFFLQNVGACQGRVCYQRGLPRLVSITAAPRQDTWTDTRLPSLEWKKTFIFIYFLLGAFGLMKFIWFKSAFFLLLFFLMCFWCFCTFLYILFPQTKLLLESQQSACKHILSFLSKMFY